MMVRLVVAASMVGIGSAVLGAGPKATSAPASSTAVASLTHVTTSGHADVGQARPATAPAQSAPATVPAVTGDWEGPIIRPGTQNGQSVVRLSFSGGKADMTALDADGKEELSVRGLVCTRVSRSTLHLSVADRTFMILEGAITLQTDGAMSLVVTAVEMGTAAPARVRQSFTFTPFKSVLSRKNAAIVLKQGTQDALVILKPLLENELHGEWPDITGFPSALDRGSSAFYGVGPLAGKNFFILSVSDAAPASVPGPAKTGRAGHRVGAGVSRGPVHSDSDRPS